MGKLSKKGKIWKVLLLEVFLLVGYLTELCLYMSQDSHMEHGILTATVHNPVFNCVTLYIVLI